MATEILYPQDCLDRRIRSIHSILSNSNGRRSPHPRSCLKKRELKNTHNPNLVMGQVMILRRGESPESNSNKGHGFGSGNDDRKKTVYLDGQDLKQVRVEFQPDGYAGSAFSQSPSPRSLPLPRFSKKKERPATVDDLATSDLRRLLRIAF